jgi:hypothetical protein
MDRKYNLLGPWKGHEREWGFYYSIWIGNIIYWDPGKGRERGGSYYSNG